MHRANRIRSDCVLCSMYFLCILARMQGQSISRWMNQRCGPMTDSHHAYEYYSTSFFFRFFCDGKSSIRIHSIQWSMNRMLIAHTLTALIFEWRVAHWRPANICEVKLLAERYRALHLYVGRSDERKSTACPGEQSRALLRLPVAALKLQMCEKCERIS